MATDDPRLNKLITQGDDGEVVIVGCPYDFFRKRAINKGGEDLGPCCLRRFYPKVGPLVNAEYDIDISKLKVTDIGNLPIQTAKQKQQEEQFKNVETKRFKGQFVNYYKQPEWIIDKISDTLGRLIKNNQLPIVFGGSKQAMLASIDAFNGVYSDNQHKNVYILSAKPFLDRLYDGNKATSQNVCTFLSSKYPKLNVKLFGIRKEYFPSQYLDDGEISWEKLPRFSATTHAQIRKTKQNKENRKLGKRTQALQKFEQIYKKEELSSVNISLEVLELFMGCRDISVDGLTFEELMQIMFFLGEQPKLKCLSISEFNPSCQDYESSLLILNALYYFLMGRAKSSDK